MYAFYEVHFGHEVEGGFAPSYPLEWHKQEKNIAEYIK
jgi:hypothetical protein